MKTVVVRSPEDVSARLKLLDGAADYGRRRLSELLDRSEDGWSVLAALKFDQVGCDPLDVGRPLNLIEQLNQIFTYKAAFLAAALLLARHPEHAPLTLNLGTAAGPDIQSEDGELLAEVFATVDPANNRKLETDIDRLRARQAKVRYVLYISPSTGGRPDEFEVDGIVVNALMSIHDS